MRNTLLLIFIATFQVYADDSYSQNTRLNLNLDNVTVANVLAEIENHSEFYFLFNSKLIDIERKVSISTKNEKISDILSSLFAGKSVDYIVYGRQIILSPVDLIMSKELQQLKITGTVAKKDGTPLSGVNVVVTGTTQGTITDVDGKYSIEVPKGAKSLTFSFIGMVTQEISIGTLTQINVTMVESEVGLEEVVVIGYGTVKKSDLTGSIATVKSAELSAFPASNVLQALSGRAGGVQIIQSTGAPGADINVRIRGANSIMGSNEPLYVIDGFPVNESNPDVLNNTDIESLEVLKDASATAIYGSRGSNGVVLITTKRGKSGQTRVAVESSFGIQTLRKKLDLCTATEYANLYNELAVNDGWPTAAFSPAEVATMGKGFDWQDFVFRKALIQNHSINVSGGNEKTQFSISGSAVKQDGIIKASNYNRYSIQANVNHDISKRFSLSYSAILTRIDEQVQSGGLNIGGDDLITATIGAYPTLTPYNKDGSYTDLRKVYSWAGCYNPLVFLNEMKTSVRFNKILTNAAITYKPISKVSIRILGGIENSDDRSDHYETTNFPLSTGIASVSTNQFTSLLNENTATYTDSIGKHHISAVAGLTFQNFLSTGLGGSGNGFLSDVTQTYNLAAASTPGIPSSSYSLSTLLSYLGRINYNYDNKYLATISLRSDGSSKYSEGNKWGYFPSGALAWRISNEDFLKGVRFLSNLKLRASVGVTGSQAIDAYATLNQLVSGKTVFGDALYTTFAPGSQLPGNLKWESTVQKDVGLDAGFFNNRIRITADYYIKDTHDLLNSVALPSSLGYISTIKNVGSIRNNGFEFEISANILSSDELTWNVDGNIAFNRNKVLKLYAGQDIIGTYYNLTILNDYCNILREGEPVGVFYGYTQNGYDNTGRLQYLDRNKDGVINEYDKTVIGNPNPDFIYGLNSTLSYKNFDLTFFLQGIQGNQIMDLSKGCFSLSWQNGLNTLKDVYENHWTPDHPNAKYPVISDFLNATISNRMIEDGSFLRLRNIQLSYNLPCKKWGVKVIRNAQIYVSGQNLLTLTKYSWWDPEVNSAGGYTIHQGGYQFSRGIGSNSINQGIDFNTYPIAKSISFGIRVGF